MPLASRSSRRPSTAHRSMWTGIAASLLAVAMTAGGAAGAFAATSGSVLDQSFEEGTDEGIGATDGQRVAQPFTAGRSGLLTDVELNFVTTIDMHGDGYIAVRNTDDAGSPVGPALASVTFAQDEYSGWTSFTFPEPARLTEGTGYVLEASAEAVLPPDSSGDSRYYNQYVLAMGVTDSVEESLFVTRADGTFIRVRPHELLFRTHMLAAVGSRRTGRRDRRPG